MRIALINAPLQSTISDSALGHQTPLGLLMVGGPLLDDGCDVQLFDAARAHWTDADVVDRLGAFQPQVVMMGHPASTPSHPCSLRLLRAVKHAMPDVVTVYGGVHPTFQCEDILAEHDEVDVVVRGEGEATTRALVRTLDRSGATVSDAYFGRESRIDLSSVAGIAWRDGACVVVNAPRPVLDDLEGSRIAWELIRDWDKYQAFGFGRTAVVQFSRGCPHRCTYCGQWPFWQRWRHRDVARFVDELEFLYRTHDVRFFWFADENPTTQKRVWKSLLQEIVRRDLEVGMTASIRAQDIVRDADILDLYRRAGFLYVLMGVETVSDEMLRKLRKNSTVDDAHRAVRLLRRHGILSVIDYIFGFEHETMRTIRGAFRGLNRYDSDFVNALYLTPYPWTSALSDMGDRTVIEQDLSNWDFRHQVVSNAGLSSRQLFWGTKTIELLYHLHPKRLVRMVRGGDDRQRRQVRFAYRHMVNVFLQETWGYLRGDRRSRSDSELSGEGNRNGLPPRIPAESPDRSVQSCDCAK